MPEKVWDPTPIEAVVNVLGYNDGDEWVALALEMDLRGYGKTFKDAMKQLHELIMMQIAFAYFKRQPEMIWKPAEPVWFQRFEDVRREKLIRMAVPRTETGAEYEVRAFSVPPPHVIKSLKDEFRLADG